MPIPPLAARAAVLLLLLAGACAPPGSTATTPRPAPTARGRDSVAAPATSFAYASGVHRYALESRATVDVRGDTADARDTLATTTWITYRIANGSAPRRIVGTVDSFTVHPGPLAAVAPAPLMAPLPFGGSAQEGVIAVDVPPEAATNCASPNGVLLGIARDLLPAFPARLTPGARWEASATTTACRGGVPMTSVVTHRYRVRGPADGEPGAVRVERRSSISLSGSGTQGGQTVNTLGRGEGEGEFVVDVVHGLVRSARSRSTLELTFTTGGASQRVTQSAEQQLRRLDSPTAQ
jgi:hypothetical protein